ncbi:hypothetical protein IMZ08_15315 [Bacillus luteolus]|uniref:Uncharacterized protein n=1 Tax=Litchfieldia luteola TaxID=682179 RepID=A0ABR9QLN8_9BACI|nr:hypothetical protein [Cytobacillus luteolus]MBE4909420.1 hypothetical protein [Cytobacillus luteolus]MBP1940820.1 hypothetical protein [Cytobacillus luteolus]
MGNRKKKKKKDEKVIKVVCKCHDDDFHCPKSRRCHSLCDRFHCRPVCHFRHRCGCHDFHHDFHRGFHHC